MERAAPLVTAVVEVQKPPRDAECNEMAATFASMMEACTRGAKLEFHKIGTKQAKIEWTDSSGQKRAFTTDAVEGVWNAENPPNGGPEIADGWQTAEKMLDAVLEDCPIRAFRTEDGLEVISWNRPSKGNHPAVVMQPVSGTVVLYYEAPAEFRTAADD